LVARTEKSVRHILVLVEVWVVQDATIHFDCSSWRSYINPLVLVPNIMNEVRDKRWGVHPCLGILYDASCVRRSVWRSESRRVVDPGTDC
jgi:hypothetical protein